LLYYTPERAKETSFVTYMQAGTGGLVQAGDPKKIDDISKLCGLTVTAGVGTVELTMAQNQATKCKAEGKPDVTIMTSTDIASGARLVASHRADVMMYDLALVDGLVKEGQRRRDRRGVRWLEDHAGESDAEEGLRAVRRRSVAGNADQAAYPIRR
jgi:polar amino acid transport system substrate-binding protein